MTGIPQPLQVTFFRNLKAFPNISDKCSLSQIKPITSHPNFSVHGEHFISVLPIRTSYYLRTVIIAPPPSPFPHYLLSRLNKSSYFNLFLHIMFSKPIYFKARKPVFLSHVWEGIAFLLQFPGK